MTVAFGQLSYPTSESETMRTVERSIVLNPEIADPHWIYPGQVFHAKFDNGLIFSHEVERKTSEYNIIKYEIPREYGQIVPPDTTGGKKLEQPKLPDLDKVYRKWDWVFPAFIILCLSLLGIKLLSMWYKQRKNQDPISAGPAQVPGGVTNEGAYGRLREIVQARYPGARMEIRNIRRSNLSGRFRVFYASASHPRLWKLLHGNKPYSRVINVVNTPGYIGEVTVNGREITISFLQACGNDTSESYMVQETDSVRVNEDGSESPLHTSAPVKTDTITQQPVVQPKENEVEVIMAEVAGMSEQFFLTQTAHKATTRFERRADGSIEIESILETFDPGRKKTEEKK